MTPNMKMKTVFIVDDDADVRESLADALGAAGYTVLLASNGKEAFGLLPTLQRPCAILLDLTMPVMNGIEFHKALRAAPAWDDIPVLISTSDPASAPKGVPVMKKPVSLASLLTRVAALF